MSAYKSTNCNWLHTMRCWLIGKLAGDMHVMVGINFHGGYIYFREAGVYLKDVTLIGNSLVSETPEMERQVMDAFNALQKP